MNNEREKIRFVGKLTAGPKEGTAFLVGDNLILSAFHNVADFDKSDHKPNEIYQDIHIDFRHYLKEETSAKKPNASVLKDSWSIVDDWVLLEYSETISVPRFPLQELTESGESIKFWAHGFPKLQTKGLTFDGHVSNHKGDIEEDILQLYSLQIAGIHPDYETKENPICALSGSPIIVNGFIVGIAQSVLGVGTQPQGGVLYATPIIKVLESDYGPRLLRNSSFIEIKNKKSGSNIQLLDCPTIPRYYFKRIDHQKDLMKLFHFAHRSDELALKILFGNSGVGKTTAASQFYKDCRSRHKLDGKWIDCRQEFNKNYMLNIAYAGDEPRIFVFDNLDETEHPAFDDNWFEMLRDSRNIIIVTTSNIDVVDKICALFSVADKKELHLSDIKPFSFDEAKSFFSKVIPTSKMKNFDVDALISSFAGSPIALQLFIDLLQKECVDKNLEERLLKKSAGSIEETLLQYWLAKCCRNPVSNKILTALSNVSSFGLNRKALIAIIDSNEKHIDRSLDPLLRVGLIMEIGRNFNSGDTTYSIRDVLRDLPVIRELQEEKELWDMRDKYTSYLEKELSKCNSRGGDCLYIDAWVSGWSWIFEDERYAKKGISEFHKGTARYVEDFLPNIIEYYDRETLSNTVIPFLRRSITSQTDCRILTGLGHVLRDMPADCHIAEMFWKATTNYDSWGRATALGCSISHWSRLTKMDKADGAIKLKEWIDNAISLSQQRHEHWCIHGKKEEEKLGMDLMVAICGLSKLQDSEAAERIILRKDYENEFGACWKPTLMILTSYHDNGKFKNPNSYELVIIKRLLSRLPSCLTPAVIRVIDYFLSQNKLSDDLRRNFTIYRRQFGFKSRATTQALDVANYADSVGLRKYIWRNEDDPKIHY